MSFGQYARNNNLGIGATARNTAPGMVDCYGFDLSNPTDHYREAIEEWRGSNGNNDPTESFSMSSVQKPVSVINFSNEKSSDDDDDDNGTQHTCSTLGGQPHTKKLKTKHVEDETNDTSSNLKKMAIQTFKICLHRIGRILHEKYCEICQPYLYRYCMFKH